MKTSIKRLLALFLASMMVLTVAGCGAENEEVPVSEVTANDDFFADDVTLIEDDDNKKENTSKEENNKTEVPKENSVSGKSADEVLAAMPKKLRGTTITMYNWNPASEYTGAPTVIQDFEKKTGIKVENYKFRSVYHTFGIIYCFGKFS